MKKSDMQPNQAFLLLNFFFLSASHLLFHITNYDVFVVKNKQEWWERERDEEKL